MILCAVAVWGLVYTIIPLYRLTVLDNELAHKTLELENIRVSLAKTYDEIRDHAVITTAMSAIGNCTGLLLAARGLDPAPRSPPWKEILDINPASCIAHVVDESRQRLGQLNNSDLEFLKAQYFLISQEVALWQSEVQAKCDSFDTVPLESLPTREDPPPGSLLGEAILQLRRRGTYVRSESQRRAEAKDVVVDKFAERVRNRIHELRDTLKWPIRQSADN